MNTRFSDFERLHRNFYKKGKKSYRLFGTGITHNGCWVENAKLVELKDICIATGKDVYGKEVFEFSIGEVWASGIEYINSNGNNVLNESKLFA